MTRLVDLQTTDDRRDVVHDAVTQLARGQTVLLPLETEYALVASGFHARAVAALHEPASKTGGLRLAVKSSHEAADYVPSLSSAGQRMMLRTWPGPVEYVVRAEPREGLMEGLPAEVRQRLFDAKRVRLACSRAAFFRDVAKLLSGPLVLTGAGVDDRVLHDWTADDLSRAFPGCGLAVSGGPVRFVEGPTVVEIEEADWRVIRPGALTETQLKRMNGTIFLFVCTGNTCRSPMAEGMFRKMLADRLQCEQDELPDRGYLVLSAGIAASDGAPASPEAVQLLLDEGIDISDHASQQLTESLLERADYVLTMTRGHRDAILTSRPDQYEKIRLVSGQGYDVSDPIGGGMSEYRHCKQEIEKNLSEFLAQFSL